MRRGSINERRMQCGQPSCPCQLNPKARHGPDYTLTRGEAGCKRTVGARLQRAGMQGTLPGATAMIALRGCRLRGRFEDFWERRATARAA